MFVSDQLAGHHGIKRSSWMRLVESACILLVEFPQIGRDKISREGKDLPRNDQQDSARRYKEDDVSAENFRSIGNEYGFCFECVSSYIEFLGTDVAKAIIDCRPDTSTSPADQLFCALYVGARRQHST